MQDGRRAEQSTVGVVAQVVDRVFHPGVVASYRAYLEACSGAPPVTYSEFVGLGAGEWVVEAGRVSLGEFFTRRLGLESVGVSRVGDDVAVGGGAGAAALGGSTGCVGDGHDGVGGVRHGGGVGVAVDAAGDAAAVGAGAGGGAVGTGACAGGDEVGGRRGPNWARNREWKQRRREVKRRRASCEGRSDVPEWRRGASTTSVPSLSGSVQTVDTRTAEEIEAARTFAARRVMENRIAVAKGEHVLASLADKEKTAALQRLAVARMEERINTARARSQASYKKCDSSLKSLGSTGSAGEFALKQLITKQEALSVENANLKKQVRVALAYGGAAAMEAVADIPEPRKFGIRDVMDPPCEGWTEQEEEAYYRIVDAEDSGNYDTVWADQFPRPGQFTDAEAAADAARYMHG